MSNTILLIEARVSYSIVILAISIICFIILFDNKVITLDVTVCHESNIKQSHKRKVDRYDYSDLDLIPAFVYTIALLY